jgi:hypothetical protein
MLSGQILYNAALCGIEKFIENRQMKIDIDKLSEEELIDLNHRIVERLKFLESCHTHKEMMEMMEFSPGDQVSFEPPGQKKKMGTLVKYNKKTVTVITSTGQKWNVSPHLLTKVKKVKANEDRGNVIELHQKD